MNPKPAHDPVNHPSHYNWLPKGIEVIDITELFNFNRGNALKYVMRAGRKDGADELEDLQKARFYLDREIKTLEAARTVHYVAPEQARADMIMDHAYRGDGAEPCTFSSRIESERTYCERLREYHASARVDERVP